MFDLTPTLDCSGRILKLDRPRVCGILNLTEDSFSGDGLSANVDAAVAQGVAMVEQGADLLDVGAESTRPGAQPVDAATEIARVVPVIEALSRRVEVPISIDTSKPEVMRAAIAAGAGLINDVYALRREGALDTVSELKVPVCLMHMQGEPGTMQDAPRYDDVVGEVHRFLAERVFACEMAGIDKRRVLVDPGFGFGKTLEHNLALLRGLERFRDLAVGVLAGLSRKAMIGTLTGHKGGVDRAIGSAAAAMIAVQRGAMIVRVHDVAATTDALTVWQAVREGDTPAKAEPKPFGSQRFGDD
ncbi:MAG: dihydropteroate synthase [Rhodanobacteraceae bacterium]|nr:MAG: dihydropteroate synthase [Rhodanobacteraceae bacterium]